MRNHFILHETYGEFRIEYTEPFDDRRNHWEFRIKYAKLFDSTRNLR